MTARRPQEWLQEWLQQAWLQEWLQQEWLQEWPQEWLQNNYYIIARLLKDYWKDYWRITEVLLNRLLELLQDHSIEHTYC